MIELRWIERETGKWSMNENEDYYQKTERILQYRIKESFTDYTAHDYDGGSYKTSTRWSQWRDVETQLEIGSK